MNNIKADSGHDIYIVVTHTGTILSQLLRFITGARYNHSSISLTDDLTQMYSFGRLYPYNPIWGGYVREHINKGVYKRFPNTDAAIMKVAVTKEKHREIQEKLEDMYQSRDKYNYNTLGLFIALFGYHFKREYDYYCSDFVREILTDHGIVSENAFGKIVKPMDFYHHFKNSIVYEGTLKDFALCYDTMMSAVPPVEN